MDLKLFASCMQCHTELGRPSFEPFIVDYYDDGIALIECSAGHKTAHLVQSPKFDILLESGATALLEGFTLEACASFSAALERFYEFAMRLICLGRGISQDLFLKMFTEMARQSERQLGAFMSLYVIEFTEHYKELPKIKEFRNSVIHKGMIPTIDEASNFSAEVYRVIFVLYRKLHEKYGNQIMSIILQDLAEKRATLPANMLVVTNTATMFFGISKAQIEPDFITALHTFKQARQSIADSTPYMQALHELLKSKTLLSMQPDKL